MESLSEIGSRRHAKQDVQPMDFTHKTGVTRDQGHVSQPQDGMTEPPCHAETLAGRLVQSLDKADWKVSKAWKLRQKSYHKPPVLL